MVDFSLILGRISECRAGHHKLKDQVKGIWTGSDLCHHLLSQKAFLFTMQNFNFLFYFLRAKLPIANANFLLGNQALWNLWSCRNAFWEMLACLVNLSSFMIVARFLLHFIFSSCFSEWILVVNVVRCCVGVCTVCSTCIAMVNCKQRVTERQFHTLCLRTVCV